MNNIVNINGRAIERIEYKDQPVITMPMMDDLHERPKRTAQRNFQKNKSKFIEGEDFYLLKGEELSQFKANRGRNSSPVSENSANRARNSCSVIGNQANEAIILTKSGYGMLVKSFNDDLAWQVQRALVNHYFVAQPMVAESIQHPDIKLTIDIGRLAKQADAHLDGVTSLRLLNRLTGMPVNDLIQKIEVKGLETAAHQMKDADLVAAYLFAVLNGGEFDGIKHSLDDEGRKCMLSTTAVMLAAMEQTGKANKLPKLGFSAPKLGSFFGRHQLELENLGWRRQLERMVNGQRFFRYTCLEDEE